MCPQWAVAYGDVPETLWLALTPDEVRELRDALHGWLTRRPYDPVRHFQIVDDFGRALTVDVVAPDDPRFTTRPARPS